jgi:hypothetical protein
LVINAAAASIQKLAAILDKQEKTAVKVKFQPFCPKAFQRSVLFGIKLYRREPPAAVGLTATAVLRAVKRFGQQDAVSLAFTPEKLHMATSNARI